jgi:predicted ATPase/class 3 adenylate cyclase
MPSTSGTLPTGTVTFLFTDIEGSTRLVELLGDGYVEVLDAHHRILRLAIEEHGGIVVSTEGDSFFAVFPTADDAAAAAAGARAEISRHPWPDGATVAVRMGIHTGVGLLGGDNYAGRDVHIGARIAAAGHGGQILLSGESAASMAVDVRSLGWFRLRGIDGEVEILEIPATDDTVFPPPRTADTPTNLPPQSSRFLGRDAEIEEVTDLVADRRLVTLVGPGGTGKTRLAIQVASTQLDRFPGGVLFVSLDAVLESEEVPAAILLALGSDGQTGGIESVIGSIGGSRVLLVLDNFEHVVDAAPALNRLLGGCPNLHVLATSQVPLDLAAESVYHVPPLGLPHSATPDGIEASDAARLFLAIVEQRSPGFAVGDDDAPTVAAIVEKLDGLPLAIELAAARVRLFGLDGLLSELDDHLVDLGGGRADAAERHRTLSSAIAWSYGLLDVSQQAVLRHASVFVGGFGIDDAVAVCRSLGRSEVIDAIDALVDRNLVVADSVAGRPRFRLLETIKAYAHGRLVDSGEGEAAHASHADRYLAMTIGFRGQLRGPDAYANLEILTTERANVDAALAWSAEHAPDAGFEALAVLARWFEVAGSLDDGIRIAERLLAAPGASDRARIAGLLGAASIAYWLLDYPKAERWYDEAFDVAEGVGDTARMREARLGLAFALVWQGRVDEAFESVERALGLDDDIDDTTMMLANQVRATGLWVRGDLLASAERFAEVMDVATRRGDTAGMLSCELVLAGLLVRSGGIRDAAPHIVSVLGRFADLGDESGAIEALDYAAVVLTELDPPVGVLLAGAVRRITTFRGGTVSLTTLGFIDVRDRARGRLDDAEIERLLAEGEALSVDEATDLVLDWARADDIEPRPVDVPDVLDRLRESSAG